MGSLQFGGVSFRIFSADHLPRHAHASYAEVVVIVEFSQSGARLAKRRDAVTPQNAKRSEVAKVIRVARLYVAELNRMWEETHGAV